jgi:hypothetical protein
VNIWPWSKIAALEAELYEAVEYIYFLQDEIEEGRQADLLRGRFRTSTESFPASGIGQA